MICPDGKNVKEYLSVYLAMAETTSLRPGWEVFATFRLFLLDQNKDNYLTVEGNICWVMNYCRKFYLDLPSGFEN